MDRVNVDWLKPRRDLEMINAAVLKAGGVLFVMDHKLMIYPPSTLRKNLILQRLVTRYERELRFFICSISLTE